MSTTNNLRSLTASSLAAALAAHRQPRLEDITNIPTALEARKLYKLNLVCQYSGIDCGSLIVPTVAGYLPLLGQWKQQQVLHPVFSLELTPLLKFAKNTWVRFCGFSTEEAEDEALTSKQEQMLQITTLALLHQLTDVRQDIKWLPDFVDVQNNWQSLIGLSYWKAYLDSTRFKFPAIRISKLESSINLQAFLQTCWDAKKAYETAVNEVTEEAKIQLAEKALAGIVDELSGKRPLSQKLLWRWFLANLPKRYAADSEGWMKTLFFTKSILDTPMTMADVDLFEEIFLSECPIGTSVSHAFLEILANKRAMLENHFEAFEMIIPMELQAMAAMGEIAEAEPKLADYPKKVHWMVAHAKWKLTHGNLSSSTQHRDAALAKQQQTTVKPSHRPELDTGRERDFDDSDIDEIDYIAPDSVAASIEDDEQAISGDLEE